MPRTKEQNEEIRQQRREAILRGALKVYAEQGYAAADIGDVAERAGIARGLVYYYFKDKQTLFRELFHYMVELSKQRTAAVFNAQGEVCRQLETFVSGMYDSMLERSEYIVFFMRMRHDLHALFPEAELKGWKWHEDNMKPMEEALARGMETGEIRKMNPALLLAQLWGAAIHGLVHGQRVAREMMEEGKTQEEVAAALRPGLQDAVRVCMRMVLPDEAGATM